MAAETFPKSLNGGGGVSFNSHKLSTVDPMSKILGFSESLENSFQIMCFNFNPKFHRGPNLSFFGLGPWAIIIHGMATYFYLSNINFDGTI